MIDAMAMGIAYIGWGPIIALGYVGGSIIVWKVLK